LEYLEGRLAPASADLAVTETGPATVLAGSSITTTITLTNNGPDAASGVVLTEADPFVPGVIVPGSGNLTAAPGNPDTFTLATQASSFTETANGPIASGNADRFILTVGTEPTSPNGSNVSSTATVTTTTTDPNPANNSSTVTTTVVQATDLGVTKTGPATVTAGTDATYTISLTNNGPVDAVNVALTDTLPAGETLVSETQLSGPDTFTDTSSGNTASFAAATMISGNADVFQVVAHAASSIANGTTLTDTASVAAANPDPTPGNNTSSVDSTVATSADLAVTKTGPAAITAGTNVTYTVSLTNSGPSDAQSVSLTDTLPAGETLVSETQLSGPDAFTDTSTGNTASFTATTVVSGNEDVFQVVAHAASSVLNGAILTDTATVSSTTPDPTPGNNTSSVNSTVATSADLAVTKTGPASITAGANVTYTISLTNSGPSDSRSVSLTDTLPAGETLVSETQLSGPDTFIDVSAGNTAGFTAATMGTGNTDVFQVITHAASGLASGTILTDTASVSSTTSDPTPGNNTSSVSSTVATSADLAVTKTGPADVVVGTNITYTISLTNIGPSNAQSISLTDALPAGLTLSSETQLSGPDTFTNTSSGNTASFSAVSVAAGHADVFQVVAHAASNLVDAAVLSDTAAVTSTTSDPNPSNNSSTATTDVVGPPILHVPGAQSVNEDQSLVFSTANGNAITVADPDNNGTDPEQLTLTVLNGTLTLGSTAGLTFISGADGTSAMTFTGTLTHLNAALNGLTYSSTNFDGSDVLTITANDLDEAQLGGPQQATATVAITVNFVNDAPSFTKGPDQSASADSGPQTVLHWATNISPGPGANEAGQTVNFIVSATIPSLFSVQPTIDSSGTLTYTPSLDAEGTAVITVLLHDNGGTANGGIDTSAPQTFTITVTPGSRQHTLFATAGGSSSIVFVIGSDGKLYEHVDATGWAAIGAAATVDSISAVTQANGSVVLFAQTTDGGLSFFVAGVGWKGHIGGAGTIQVISAGLDFTGQASVFVIDTNGHLDEWSTSSGWRTIPASPAGGVVQLSAVDNDRVYVVTANQSVYGNDRNLGWFPLTSPGFARSISATDDGQGHVTVYAVTPDEALFRHDDATGWTQIGGTGTIDVVSAGRDRANEPNVFAITTSSDLAENDTLAGWSILRPPASAVKLSATLADRVFAVLADGSVYGHDDTFGFFPLAGSGFAEV
jgi:uncharacterized repeat protein (TIGR01451 family)